MDNLNFRKDSHIMFFGLLVNLLSEIRPITRKDWRAPFYVGFSENIKEFFLNEVPRDATL